MSTLSAPEVAPAALNEGFRIQRAHRGTLPSEAATRRAANARAALRLARRVREHNPGYARLWRERSAAADAVPVLDKDFLAEHFDEFATGLPVTARAASAFAARPFTPGSLFDPGHLVFSSSGSTGRPLPVLYTLEDFGRSLVAFLDRAVLADRPGAASLLYIGLMDRHNGGNAWMYHLGGALRTRLADVFAPPEELLDTVLELRPDVILTRPHLLLALGELAAGRGLAPAPAHLLSVGEALQPEQRDGIARRWGAAPRNSYSTVETGPLGYQDDLEREELAVYDELHHVELLDAEHRPITVAGVPGRVVVTTLYRATLPLVRYRIGDVAAWADARMTRITFPLGRDSRELRLRTAAGSAALPELSLWSLRVPGLRQYQVVQTAPGTLLVRCEPSGSVPWPDLAARVRAALDALVRKGTGLGVRIECEQVTALVPDRASGKVKRVVPFEYQDAHREG
jgi:phenylacetate-CoA ligase